MTEARWFGFHFLEATGALRYGDGRIPKDGELMECRPNTEPELCTRGMHASARLIDAIKQAPGPILCRVELVGTRIDGDDKSTAVGRTILWRIDATDFLRRFAYWCADDQIHRLIPHYFRLAIDALKAIGDTQQVKLLTTRLEALEACQPIVDEKTRKVAAEELSAAAWSAAESAAWSAARSAAWSAARSAAESAAWSAAWSAAESAAWSAAWSAARSAAWSAAESAAWSAAESAAWSAARSAQEIQLLQMLAELRGTEDLNEVGR